jgi:hypothetical protein
MPMAHIESRTMMLDGLQGAKSGHTNGVHCFYSYKQTIVASQEQCLELQLLKGCLKEDLWSVIAGL